MFLVCLIPGLIALGHDAYLYTLSPEEGIRFASFGWAWATYHPQTLTAAFEALNEDMAKQIEFFLGFKISLVFGLLTIILPTLIATEYYLLRLIFGKIGPTTKPNKKGKNLAW